MIFLKNIKFRQKKNLKEFILTKSVLKLQNIILVPWSSLGDFEILRTLFNAKDIFGSPDSLVSLHTYQSTLCLAGSMYPEVHFITSNQQILNSSLSWTQQNI